MVKDSRGEGEILDEEETEMRDGGKRVEGGNVVTTFSKHKGKLRRRVANDKTKFDTRGEVRGGSWNASVSALPAEPGTPAASARLAR